MISFRVVNLVINSFSATEGIGYIHGDERGAEQ